MDRKPSDPKRAGKEKQQMDPAIVGEEDEDDEDESHETEEKKRRPPAISPNKKGGGGPAGGGGGVVTCQAEKCLVDLTEAKKYHRRHKVCEAHSKDAVVIVAGLRQRFCQQCSRFHELSEFDETKRSCRRRLAGHNERRRKNSTECQGEGSSQCSPAYKHFQIR